MHTSRLTKYISGIFLSAFIFPLLSSITFAIGQFGSLATAVVGQPDFNTVLNARYGLNYNTFSGVINGRLYIADNNSGRIVGYNSIPNQNQQSLDFVIGHPTIDEVGYSTSRSTLNSPGSFSTDGSKFYISELGNNRVLIYNSVPTTSGVLPDMILGQPDYISNTANNGGISASSLYRPYSVYASGTKLFVSDYNNNRVLIWNNSITASNQPADLVLGQPGFTSNTANNGGRSASSLYYPYGVYSDGTRLFVSDYNNNRVLIWNNIPTASNQPADLVLGQPDFVSGTANNGGVSAHSLSGPSSVFVSGNRFIVADSVNSRVLIWNSIPTTNNQNADIVVGQPNFSSNTANNGGIERNTLKAPRHAMIYDGKLHISDSGNYRHLIFNSIPVSNGASADIVLGQPDFTSYVSFNPRQISKMTYNAPYSINTVNGKTVVSDFTNSRVLIYNNFPNSSSGDVVLGQPDFISNKANNGGISASSIYSPQDAFSDGTRLFVADYANHRVLIWNSMPTSNKAPADLVLGQPNFTSNAANNGGRSASTFYYPSYLYSDGTRLFVTDLGNSRVLIWNTIPTVNGQPADIVLGQPNFSSGTANNGGISASSLYYPYGISTYGTKLFVSDSSNNRILVWNTIPTVNNQPADLVLGQSDFTSNLVNGGNIGANTLNRAYGMSIHDNHLYVADTQNHRVLIWNSIPTISNTPADIVLSQPDFISFSRNAGVGVINGKLNFPTDVMAEGTDIYVVDSSNHRIQIFPLGPQNTSAALPLAVKSTSVTLSLSADDAKEMMISNNPSFTGANWEAFSSSKQLTLSPVEGEKIYYVKYKDYANYIGNVITVSTKLDTTSPTGGITVLSPDSNGYTNSQTVTVKLNASDTLSGVTQMKISEDSTFTDIPWESYSTSKQLALSSGDGTKTIYVKYMDSAGNISEVYGASIILDTSLEVAELILEESQDLVYDKLTDSYIVDTSTPTIIGMGEPGSLVVVSYKEEELGRTTVKENRHWSITLDKPLSNGTYNLDIAIKDKAGNILKLGLSLTVKRTDETKPSDQGNDDQPNKSGNENKGADLENTFNFSSWLMALWIVFGIGIYVWYRYNKKRK